MENSNLLKSFYESIGLSNVNSHVLTSITIIVLILTFAFLVNFIVKRYLMKFLQRVAEKTKTQVDDILFSHKVIFYITHLVPSSIIYLTFDFAFDDNIVYPFDVAYITKIVYSVLALYVYAILWIVLFALIDAAYEIFQQSKLSKDVDIKGFLQLLKVLVSLVFVILVVSKLIDKKPGAILAALGAVAAVLMFVFRDTLLGFVAGIQIAANKMAKPGDWVSMPTMGTDGTILEIGLTTVKIQNWDKTISTVPTYALVSKSFANWKGMEASGGRRIKRSFFIDVSSIKFCSSDMIEKYKNIHLLKSYIEEKQKEIEDYNKSKNIEANNIVNSRYLTNIGTFRKYIELYLKEHPKLKQNLTLLVRQLQVTPEGLPMEIYVFSADQQWVNYEAIQADIFDHIFSVIHEFDLSLFQSPTGSDFNQILKQNKLISN